MQVYAGPANSKLYGLAIADDDPVSPLIVTAEQHSGKCRALFVRRNSAAKLQIVQSVVIDETIDIDNDFVTFARWPEGNLFCAKANSSILHEFSRALSASRSPFEDNPRKHPLSNTIRCICGLQSNGVCRIAASFNDDSIRVFRVAAAGGALTELQRITPPQPQTTWHPLQLFALPGGSLVVCNYLVDFTDPTDSKDPDPTDSKDPDPTDSKDPDPTDSEDQQKFGIECCAAKSDGTLSFPKRLIPQELQFALLGLLSPTKTFPSYRFAAVNTDDELCLLSINAQ